MRAPFFVTAAAGTADLLASELAALGIEGAREVLGGVACEGDARGRLSRLPRIAPRPARAVAARAIPGRRMRMRSTRACAASTGARSSTSTRTLAVDFSGSVPGITHTQFGAQRVKDAIVDQFREKTGARPSVDRDSPTCASTCTRRAAALTIAIDLSGESLHRRGYRGGRAPRRSRRISPPPSCVRAGWPAIAAAGGAFVDPMCGSGTLPIEAALIAADIAPGLSRERFGFERWRSTMPPPGQALRAAARSAPPARSPDARAHPRLRSRSGRDPRRRGERRAGGARRNCSSSSAATSRTLPAAPAPTGLIAVNPPYGERIGEAEELRALYALLGERLRAGYRGWEAAVFTGNPALGRELGINARRTHRMMNGPIECRLLRLSIEPSEFVQSREPGRLPRDRRRGGARAAGRADVREPPAQELRKLCRAGRSASRSPATASTTRTCPSTPSPSTSTSPIRQGPQAAGSTCRNTRRPRRSIATRPRARREEAISDAARSDRPCRPTRSTGARAGRRRASPVRGDRRRAGARRGATRAGTSSS